MTVLRMLSLVPSLQEKLYMDNLRHLQLQHPLKQQVASRILPTAMLPYLLACRLLKSFSAYETVIQATDDPEVAKRFLSQLSESRRTSITILSSILTHALQAPRASEIDWIVSSILLTMTIGALYDGIDDVTFRHRVEGLGPALFTVIISLPGVLVVFFLIFEMFYAFNNPIGMAGKMIFIAAPLFFQVLGEIRRIWSQLRGEMRTKAGDVEQCQRLDEH